MVYNATSPETNLINTPDLGEVQAIDFVNRFAESIAKLREAFGITRDQPMTQGNTIQRWNFTVTPPEAGTVIGEGEDIPLTHVARTKGATIEVGFEKARKAVSIEEVQRVGYDLAVSKTDSEALKFIQRNIRTKFFDYLSETDQSLGTFSDLQKAVAQTVAKMQDLFDDDEANPIIFLNPYDAAKYLGDAQISNGVAVGFGLTLLRNFIGNVDIMINRSVPQGTFYATVRDNINLMHLDTNGESRRLFVNKQVTTDELGLISLVADDNTTNLTNQTTMYWGIELFAEVTNGVVKGTLADANNDPAPTVTNTKAEILEWLLRHGKTNTDVKNKTKIELLEMVSEINTPTPQPEETPAPTESNTEEEIKAWLLAKNPERTDLDGKTKEQLLELVAAEQG